MLTPAQTGVTGEWGQVAQAVTYSVQLFHDASGSVGSMFDSLSVFDPTTSFTVTNAIVGTTMFTPDTFYWAYVIAKDNMNTEIVNSGYVKFKTLP